MDAVDSPQQISGESLENRESNSGTDTITKYVNGEVVDSKFTVVYCSVMRAVHLSCFCLVYTIRIPAIDFTMSVNLLIMLKQ